MPYCAGKMYSTHILCRFNRLILFTTLRGFDTAQDFEGRVSNQSKFVKKIIRQVQPQGATKPKIDWHKKDDVGSIRCKRV